MAEVDDTTAMTDQPLPLKPSDEFICVIHDSSACPDCVTEYQKTEAQLAEKEAEIEGWKRVVEQARKDYEREVMERASQVREIEELRAFKRGVEQAALDRVKGK